MLENPRREVGLKRNNNKVIEHPEREVGPKVNYIFQSTGKFSINKVSLPSSFVHTHLASAQV
jgi:hypothetical protein